jgi:uncharacterized phage protein (TIGR01671 family)
MREIKFRAKSLDGTWVYGELHLRSMHPHMHTISGIKHINENTVGQFTGMYDKNGKEIYEGDFVRYHMHERGIHESEYQTGLVEFGGGRFYADLDCSTLYFCGDSEDYEVIGNKWDNPEL